MQPLPKRATLVRLAALAVAGLPAAAMAQRQGKALRVGLIGFSSADLRSAFEQSLVAGLRERGYVQGKNLVLERRYADGQPVRVGEIAGELAALDLDAIVTTCTPTTAAMRKVTRTTPLVMASVSDPVGQGFIESYAHPGGNVTGLATQFEDVAGKMLELFIEAVPAASPVAVLFNPGNPVHRHFLRDLEVAANPLDARLLPVGFGLQTDLASMFESMASQGAASLMVLPDDTLLGHFRRELVAMSRVRRLPSFFGARDAVEEGGLMSYGESARRTYSRVAYYLDRIAEGASPANLPVEQPTRFELTVNLKTARDLGLTLPQAILLRADRLIE